MRNEDSMRYNLVTKFVCSQCGMQLALSYKSPKVSEWSPDKEDRITGAAKVEQNIAIHPCDKCYGEATAPIEAMRKALEGMKVKQ